MFRLVSCDRRSVIAGSAPRQRATALDDQLQRDSGLSHFEYGILAALSEADDGTLRMSELAIYANGSLSRLSRAVARLEGRGWVTRKPDSVDGRYTLATITNNGRTMIVNAAPGHVEAVNRLVFDVLTTAQARQLRIIAGRILNAIDSEMDMTSQASP
jgi:DNA-binding MarR family transcriptional regulator